MSTTEDTFYEGKRPWSIVKDRVIGDYIHAYSRKVAKLRRPIIIIDAFAGPGVFADGSEGSPLLICSAASGVRAEWRAVFINRNPDYHNQLTSVVEQRGWSENVQTVFGDASKQLVTLEQGLGDETIFLYLDPFGLKGCDFRIVRSYLERALEGYSVEVLINMSMPTLHRLATYQAVSEGRGDSPQIIGLNRTLTQALGGDWWKDVMWKEDDPSSKEQEIMRGYTEQVRTFLPYTGYLPVRESASAAVKYYITYGSGHPDGLLLMNDIMLRSYENYIFRAEAGAQGTLWGWETGRNLGGLEPAIVEAIRRDPNRTREEIWYEIVERDFLLGTRKEYRDTLKKLADQGTIIYPPDPGTGYRNKNSRLSLPE